MNRRVDAALAGTREQHPPPSFRERLQSLAGGTTWREPMLGGGGSVGSLPAAHALAAALGMARGAVCASCKAPWYECRKGRCKHCDATTTMPDPSDVGPDVACDVLFGRTTYAARVGRAVADAMARDRARACRRCRPWLRIVCWAAYVELVHGMPMAHLRPAEMAQADWALLTRAAGAIMEALGEDAVQRARRAWVGERRAG